MGLSKISCFTHHNRTSCEKSRFVTCREQPIDAEALAPEGMQSQNHFGTQTCFGSLLKQQGESGQALIEFSLCMGILVSLLIGAVEFGRMEYASIEVTDAAMAAVQYATEDATTAADTTGIQTAATNAAPDVTLQPTSVSTSCICSDGSASTCLSTDCSTSAIEKIITVQTQGQFTSILKVPGVPNTFTLNGRAVQKVLE